MCWDSESVDCIQLSVNIYYTLFTLNILLQSVVFRNIWKKICFNFCLLGLTGKFEVKYEESSVIWKSFGSLRLFLLPPVGGLLCLGYIFSLTTCSHPFPFTTSRVVNVSCIHATQTERAILEFFAWGKKKQDKRSYSTPASLEMFEHFSSSFTNEGHWREMFATFADLFCQAA